MLLARGEGLTRDILAGLSASCNKKNTHYRVYQADAWTTLARPASQDPPEIYKLPSNFDPDPKVLKRAVVLPRYYFPELAALAPRKGVTFTIELPASATDRERGIARQALHIFWKRQGQRAGAGGPLALEPRLIAFHRCLTCPERVFGRNEFVYPNPVEFNMQLQREYPIAHMQLLTEVTAPDGSKRQAPVMDDGTGGYRAQLPYHMGGQYLVQLTFTNPNLAARFTNAGLEYIPSVMGLEPPVVDEPVGVPITVTVTTTYTVAGFAADDHGDAMATATAMAADNSVIGGRIDRAGDVDQFTVVAGQSGAFIVRVVDLSPGMRPRLTVTRGNGEVLFGDAFDSESAPYLFASLQVKAGERLYAAVTDAAQGEGSFYQISAGHPLSTATENSPALFLPIVVR